MSEDFAYNQSLTNVDVYPYLPIIGPTPVEPVLTGATGTYSIASLFTDVSYGLYLSGGEHVRPLEVGQAYVAIGTSDDGKQVFTHWMRCTAAGDQPTFGLTRNILKPHDTGSTIPAATLSRYITLAEVENVTVTQNLANPPLFVVLVEDAKGALISTRIGTPFLTGFRIDSEKLSRELHVGEHNLTVTAKEVESGKTITLGPLTCTDAGDPSILLAEIDYR